ncbi:MAG: class I SAM-dependent methyltransferase [Sphingobacteriales bacterium]|nr:MAG: class I SAM-dependent methyltransferase [Sphingobacteriales bacterium]
MVFRMQKPKTMPLLWSNRCSLKNWKPRNNNAKIIIPMNAAQETYATWNKMAGLYQEKFMQLDIYDQSYDLFCSYIEKVNAQILEIGCGPGMICKYLLAKRPDLEILGTDFAPNMIALAAKHNPGAHFKVLDARQTKSLDRKFDAIISGFCLPYLNPEEVQTLIADLKDMLEPKGVLYLSFIPGNPAQSGMMTASSGDRTLFYFHLQDEILKLLHSNQFRVLGKLAIAYAKPSGQEIHAVIIAARED